MGREDIFYIRFKHNLDGFQGKEKLNWDFSFVFSRMNEIVLFMRIFCFFCHGNLIMKGVQLSKKFYRILLNLQID